MTAQPTIGTPHLRFPEKGGRLINMLGVEFLNYRVTSRSTLPGSEAIWLCDCASCGQSRAFTGANIRKALRGDRSIARCRCLHAEDVSFAVERLGVSTQQARTQLAAMAHYRAYGVGVLRSALVKFMGGQAKVSLLIQRGWLKAAGARLVATDRAWEALALDRGRT